MSSTNSLFKINDINIDIIKFTKYEVRKNASVLDEPPSYVLKDILGTESHRATQDVILELARKTGELIKSFKVEKTKHGIRITSIEWIDK